MVKLSKNTKSKKQKHTQKHIGVIRQKKTRSAHNFSKYNIYGGAGRIVINWCDQPEFEKINGENENMLQISALHEDVFQHDVYYNDLGALLQYNNYEINMDFISNFYKHIYYDINGKYAIDIRGENKKWYKNGDDIKYVIEDYHVNPTHQNTTIVFLKSKTEPLKEKVIKIFNNIYCDINKIREFLALEISHISKQSRNYITQHNYLHYDNLDTFNKFNFNQKKYYIPEISENKSNVYLSCRNADPINEYIINLIIGFINSNAKDEDKINYVHYDNLFVTTVYSDKDPTGKQCWCLLMDKVDGSLDSLILNKHEKVLSPDTILNYLQQAENLLKPLKTADYLFTHTDMKLENLFYKQPDANNTKKIVLYLADLDKSSITFKGIRFYNNITKNPNLKTAGVSIIDPVQGYAAILKGDSYIDKSYPERKISSANNEQYEYRISRIGRVNNPFTVEFEAFYMRYNNQPFYTSFDIISLWLSILHFRCRTGAIIDFKDIKSSKFDKFLTKYMTKDTINLLTDFYSGLEVNYGGNFGQLLQPIFNRKQSQLDQIKFIQNYNATEPKLIEGLYLTANNKLALSLPFVPTSITVKGEITSFKPDKTATAKHGFYKDNTNVHVTAFINALNNENILTVTYTSDYSVVAQKGERFASIIHSKPPTYIIKTNRYSHLKIYYYEWDYMVNESDLPKLIKLFEKLATPTLVQSASEPVAITGNTSNIARNIANAMRVNNSTARVKNNSIAV